MLTERPKIRFLRVPIWRRGVATAIDLLGTWLIISSLTGLLQILGFMLIWLLLRVILVFKNRGQSLGRWSLDLKLVDPRFGKTPEIQISS